MNGLLGPNSIMVVHMDPLELLPKGSREEESVSTGGGSASAGTGPV